MRDPDMAGELSRHGAATILERHTCSHRVDELLDVVAELQQVQMTDKRQDVIGATA
jgi:spore maturation protein CgeB